LFTKCVDRADQYLSYYSLLRKTVKWPKKAALCLTNYAHFNSFRIYKKLNPAIKMRYKEFLLQVAKDWAADKMEVVEPVRHRLNVTRTINLNPT
jgi:hypothetical protein